MSLAPTTELEAVNTMLNTIGEAPVNTLVNMTSVDAITALSVLQSVNREVQSQGWFFNYEYNYPLTPNQNGELSLPTNIMSVDSSNVSHKHDLVQRGSRAYDRLNHTYIFDEAVKCDLILLLSCLRKSQRLQGATLFSVHPVCSKTAHLALTHYIT